LVPAGDGSNSMCMQGWVVDPTMAGGGVPPVNVTLTLDRAEVPAIEVVANIDRPDIVKAHMAPNPEHGFRACLTPEQWAPL